jgi:hypothetical protein
MSLMDQQLGYRVKLKTAIKVEDFPTATRRGPLYWIINSPIYLFSKGFDDST